jgi:hypothetical protein
VSWTLIRFLIGLVLGKLVFFWSMNDFSSHMEFVTFLFYSTWDSWLLSYYYSFFIIIAIWKSNWAWLFCVWHWLSWDWLILSCLVHYNSNYYTWSIFIN